MPGNKDFTPQEKLVAEVLTELDIRFIQQYSLGPYLLDFFLEGKIVCEADGNSHWQKKDRKRDEKLKELGVNAIIHIVATTKNKIREELLSALECLG